MKYFDKRKLTLAIAQNPIYHDMLQEMEKDTNDFFEHFDDDPTRLSEWGHHYFCKDDGGLLQFDLLAPQAHRCPICNRIYSSDLLNGVWTYFYRNQVALNLWKSAILLKMTRKIRYLNYMDVAISMYAERYQEFRLHNKERESFDSLETAKWGCGRIMPQGLNESIFIIRFLVAMEIVKDKITTPNKQMIDGMIQNAYQLLRPQVDKIHNISVWCLSAIAVMGLFSQNLEMIEFAFDSPLGLNQQLKQGLSKDSFWFEGSIHYNFFVAEAISQALIFAKIYHYKVNRILHDSLQKMLKSAYDYAFSNIVLPNPNDGWPNINLKTYAYVYDMALYLYGEDSVMGDLAKNIYSSPTERIELPLSKPYYFQNRISLERLTLIPGVDFTAFHPLSREAHNFRSSQFAILRNELVEVFVKYGHNGPSHAHPDKMSIEVTLGGKLLTRDLSNAGYGSDLCNEWHRTTASHSTVVINGHNQISMRKGKCIHFRKDYIRAEAEDVYRDLTLDFDKMRLSMNHDEVTRYLMRYLSYTKEQVAQIKSHPETLQKSLKAITENIPKVDYTRIIKLEADGLIDRFVVNADREVTADYFFHSEAKWIDNHKWKPVDIGYYYYGYQHLHDVKELRGRKKNIVFEWMLGSTRIRSTIRLTNAQKLYVMKTLDNPVNQFRDSFMIRDNSRLCQFKVTWQIVKEE